MTSPRVVVVSGGSRGLGLAVVEHFLAKGEVVCTFARKPTPAIEAHATDESTRARLLFQVCDAADRQQVQQLVRTVLVRFGRIDLLVNNAGLARDGLLTLASYRDIDQMIDVNQRGMLYLTRACLRAMIRARSGCIVNVSSVIGLRGFRGLAAYAGTKAAMDAVTRALAREVGALGIRVNSVAPGYLETEMTHGLSAPQLEQIARRTPLGRLGSPEDVVRVIDFLASEAAAFVTGQVIVVDGGLSA